MFESGMARLAARKITPDQMRLLRAALARLSASRGNPAEFVAADMAFHVAIASVSENPIYSAVSHALLQWFLEIYPRLLRAPGTEELTLREHGKILDAIDRNDEDAAAAAIQEHLLRSNPLYSPRGQPKTRQTRARRRGA